MAASASDYSRKIVHAHIYRIDRISARLQTRGALKPCAVTALIREQVVTRLPTSPDELATIQDAFNLWSEQSGKT